jgi:PadR family transcriptional regulator PadR
MVLKTLDAMGPLHGYGIARRIEQISDEAYKAKFYSISKAGRKQLAAETENWERVSGVIGRLLQIASR